MLTVGGVAGTTTTALAASACTPSSTFAECADGYSPSGKLGWPDTYYYYASSGGHNCTLYVAYRLKMNGLGDPGGSFGEADQWPTYVLSRLTEATGWAAIKDHKPEVGSIAEFGPGSRGSSGHVAYVEELLSGGKVLISEDDFTSKVMRLETVTTASVSWFIHVHRRHNFSTTPTPSIQQATATSASDPTILRTVTGTWAPGTVTFTYQWYENGKKISSATDKDYTVPKSHRSSVFSVAVEGHEDYYNLVTKTSAGVVPNPPGASK